MTHDQIMEWITEVQSIDFVITQEVLTRSSVLTILEDFLSE
jgi:hypothetical protein